jgi:hypothetical protein
LPYPNHRGADIGNNGQWNLFATTSGPMFLREAKVHTGFGSGVPRASSHITSALQVQAARGELPRPGAALHAIAVAVRGPGTTRLSCASRIRASCLGQVVGDLSIILQPGVAQAARCDGQTAGCKCIVGPMDISLLPLTVDITELSRRRRPSITFPAFRGGCTCLARRAYRL